MTIIVKRILKDYDSWKKLVNDNEGLRQRYGSRGARIYRSARNPNEVHIVFDWADVKPYQEYFNLPDVRTALKASGVGPTEIIEVGETFTLAS